MRAGSGRLQSLMVSQLAAVFAERVAAVAGSLRNQVKGALSWMALGVITRTKSTSTYRATTA